MDSKPTENSMEKRVTRKIHWRRYWQRLRSRFTSQRGRYTPSEILIEPKPAPQPYPPLTQWSVDHHGEIPEILVRLGQEIERVAGKHGIYRQDSDKEEADELVKSLRNNEDIDFSKYRAEPQVLSFTMKLVFINNLAERAIPFDFLTKLVNIHWLLFYPEYANDQEFRSATNEKQLFKEISPLHPNERASLMMMCLIRDLPDVGRNMVAFMLLHFQHVLSSQQEIGALNGQGLAAAASFWYYKIESLDRSKTFYLKKASLLMGSIYRDWSTEFICLAKTSGSETLSSLCSQSRVNQVVMARLEQRMLQLNHADYTELEARTNLVYGDDNYPLVDYKCSQVTDIVQLNKFNVNTG